MKKEIFFIKTLFVNLFVVSLFYFLSMEYLVRKYVLIYDHDFQRSILFKKSKVRNTIWGDSGTMTAINKLAGFINLSAGSQNFQEIELKIKIYYSNKEKEKGKIILQLPLNAFAGYRDRPLSDALKDLYFSNSKINFYMSYNYFRERSYEYIKNFITNKFQIKLISDDRFNSDGSVTYFKKYLKANENIPYSIPKNPNIYIPKLSFKNDPNKLALERIIKFLNESKIDSCFVTTPWHQDYFQYVANINKFKNIREYYNKISNKNNILYFDYAQLKYHDFFFSNESHLSEDGSKAFTKLVSESCFPKKIK